MNFLEPVKFPFWIRSLMGFGAIIALLIGFQEGTEWYRILLCFVGGFLIGMLMDNRELD